MRAEIPDAGLHVQHAVRPNRHQAVVADRSGAVRADGHADAPHLRSAALARTRRALVQSNVCAPRSSASLTKALVDVATPAAGGGRSVGRLAFGRVDAPDGDLIQSKLARGLADDGLHDAVGLHRSRRALLGSRRRVRQHRHAAPSHRERLPDERCGVGRRPVIAHRSVRSVVFDDEEVERRDAAVLSKPTRARPTMPVRARPMQCSSSRLMRIITGCAGFLRQQRRNGHRDGARALAAEAAAAVLADRARLSSGSMPTHRAIGSTRSDDALRRAVQKQLAVLPVGHRRSGFHRLVAGGLHHERLVDDLRGVAEAGLEIAVRPFFRRRPHRQTTLRRFGHLFGRPLQRPDWPAVRRLRPAPRARRREPRVSLEPRVCAVRLQALDRIDDEGQRLEGRRRCARSRRRQSPRLRQRRRGSARRDRAVRR